MCECSQKIYDRIIKHVQEKHPEGTNHGATLDGYGLTVNNKGETRTMAYMPATMQWDVKTKSGVKTKKIKTHLFHSHCCFCGEKIEA